MSQYLVWAWADGADDSGQFYGPFQYETEAASFYQELQDRLNENGGEWYVYVCDLRPAVLPPKENQL